MTLRRSVRARAASNSARARAHAVLIRDRDLFAWLSRGTGPLARLSRSPAVNFKGLSRACVCVSIHVYDRAGCARLPLSSLSLSCTPLPPLRISNRDRYTAYRVSWKKRSFYDYYNYYSDVFIEVDSAKHAYDSVYVKHFYMKLSE